MRAKVGVPISYVMKNVTIEVKLTGLIKWYFQVWVAKQLFKLAAFILNLNIDFKRAE